MRMTVKGWHGRGDSEGEELIHEEEADWIHSDEDVYAICRRSAIVGSAPSRTPN